MIAFLITAFSSGWSRPSCAGDGTNQTTAILAGSSASAPKDHPATTKEDLGYDIFAGKTNKIARVHSASAAWVYVIYQGGLGGRKIPRQDLPPELQAQFSYDPIKAADYQKRQAAVVAQQWALAAQQATKARTISGDAAVARLLAQEQGVQQEIENFRIQDVELTKTIERLENLGRYKAAATPKEERQVVRDRMVELKALRDQIQEQMDALPKSKATFDAEVARLQKRDNELQKEIENLRSLPGGHGRDSKAYELQAEQKAVRQRLEALRAQGCRTP